MAIAEGTDHLHSPAPEAIDVAVLETFEYAGAGAGDRHGNREFSAGLSLQRTARLRQAAASSTCRRDRCIELKSLKYYVTSFRNVGIFQEHATARIAEDLFRVLQPQMLSVTTIYNVRGGFETRCTVRLPKE